MKCIFFILIWILCGFINTLICKVTKEEFFSIKVIINTVSYCLGPIFTLSLFITYILDILEGGKR